MGTYFEALNQLYRMGRGRIYKTEKAYDWQTSEGWKMKMAWGGKKPLQGPLRFDMTIYYKRDRDLDSSEKLIWDTLQGTRVIENDSQFVEKHVYKKQDKEFPRLELFVERIEV